MTVNAAVPAVISASPAYTTAAVNQEITYTVKTPSNAKFLALYSGSSKLKVWGMTGNSTLSGSIRVWTVSYAFKGAGIKRVVSFKCSANGTYGTGKSVAATIAGRFLTQGTSQKISGYGELTVKWADDMYSLGILSSGSTTDGVVKKTSYDYGHFKGLCVYIKNLSSTAHDFTANCSVKVILNGATTYEGFLHMFNPNVDIDAIRSGGWINYVSKRVMMNDADIYLVPAGETGQYCFICDLPNTALSSDAGPLVMYITLDGKTFAYTLR